MNKIIIIALLISISTYTIAQTSSKSIAELEQEKKEAIANENYDLAGELKIQIEEKKKALEAQNGKPLSELTAEKEEALKNEDFAKASELKKQIDERTNYLNRELKVAIANEDYDKAANIKNELNHKLSLENDKVNQNPNVNQKTKEKKKHQGKFVTTLQYGLIHDRVSYPNNDYKSYYIPLELVKFDENRVVGIAQIVQFAVYGSSYELEDIYSFSSFTMSTNAGFGISTNFGLKNNNSRIKPFAYSTAGIGINLNVATVGVPDSSGDLKETTTSGNTFSFHYTLRAGASFYMTDKLALSVSMGLNNFSFLNVGLTF